jgi:hypothetical protein
VRLCGIVAGLAIGATLAGCGGTKTDSAASGASGTTASQPTVTRPARTAPEAFSGGRATVTGSPQDDATALLEQIDLGRHDGFDRVVFRFRGAHVPGYRVGFVDPPLSEDGSGAAVPIDGKAIIGVRLEPASGFDLGQGEGTLVYKGPKRIEGAPAGMQAITELARTGDFEAVLNWAIGLDHASDFRVLRLDSPARLVVDVQS